MTLQILRSAKQNDNLHTVKKCIKNAAWLSLNICTLFTKVQLSSRRHEWWSEMKVYPI